MDKKRVLIADDDMGLVQAMAIRLKNAGFEVICGTDSYQALSQAMTTRPDVIILDINMPCGKGFTVHERLRQSASVAAPVIYLTGDKDPDIDAISRRLGAYALIYKPFEVQQLLSTVHQALNAA
ncbi:MAG: response regulator [Phycisphaerae bacterium]